MAPGAQGKMGKFFCVAEQKNSKTMEMTRFRPPTVIAMLTGTRAIYHPDGKANK